MCSVLCSSLTLPPLPHLPVRPVLKYPHPGLRQHNEPITDFSADVRKTAQQMLRLMYAANGIGLAAPQVGVNQRMMVFNE